MKLRTLVATVVLGNASALAQTTPGEPPPGEPVVVEAEPVKPPPPPSKPPVTLVYDNGTVLRAADDLFELKLTGRFQGRFELTRSTADGAEFLNRFSVPRGRFNIEGFFFGKDNRYKMEFAFADNGAPQLKDFFIDKKIAGPVWFRLGQFRRPFNRVEMTSDFALEFIEKPISSTFGAGGRDIGIALHDRYDSSPEGLEWVLALVNGTGERATQTATTTCVNAPIPTDPPICTTTVSAPSNVPADWRPMIFARVGWNIGAIKGYNEGDLDGGDLRLGAGVGYKLDMATSTDADNWAHAVQGDVILKVSGLDVSAAIALVKNPGADSDIAFHVQGGYFLIPKNGQVVARVSLVPTAGTDTNTIEGRLGFNWYWFGHNLKLLYDIGFLKDTADGAPTTVQVRFQGQAVF